MRYSSRSRVAVFAAAIGVVVAAYSGDTSTLNGPRASTRKTNTDTIPTDTVAPDFTLTVIVGAGHDSTADTLAYTPLPGSTVQLSSYVSAPVGADSTAVTVTPISSATTDATGAANFSGLLQNVNYQVDVTPPAGSGLVGRRIRLGSAYPTHWTLYSQLYPQ